MTDLNFAAPTTDSMGADSHAARRPMKRVARRRRGGRAPRPARAATHTIALAACVCTLALSLPAVSPAGEVGGGDGQTLLLTAPHTSVLGTHTAATLGMFGYSASVSSQFLRDPFVVARDGEILRHIVRNRVDVTTHGAFGILDWLDLGFDLPVVAYMDGEALGPDDERSAGMGDLRVWTKMTALQQRLHHLDLGAVLTLGSPTGDSDAFRSAGGLTLDASLLLARRLGPVYLALSAGYELRPERTVLDYIDDDRITFSLAASWREPSTALTVEARVFGSARASAPFERAEETNLEAVAGLTWQPVGGFVVQLGLGAGLMPGAGTPTYRAFAGVGWAMPTRASEGLVPEEPADSDGDGIIDLEDECPTEPEDIDGFEDENGCPDPDNDGDGIPDAVDECPDEPEDVDEFEDENGCPDPDNDGDGIADVDDKCPLEPETKNGFEDDDGCADETLVALDLERGRIEVLLESMVHFDWNDADVPEDYLTVMKQVAYIMKSNPEIRVLQVEGHTSWTGGHAYNMELSRNRAAAVVGWLMHFGVEPERILARGFGFTQLRVQRRGPRFNWINRRVEFVIVDPPVARLLRRPRDTPTARGRMAPAEAVP